MTTVLPVGDKSNGGDRHTSNFLQNNLEISISGWLDMLRNIDFYKMTDICIL